MYDYFMEKLVYQMFILGTGGDNNIGLNTALEKGLGGVILFTKDIISEQQLKKDIEKFKQKSLLPPFISIDQEGGRVERTEIIRPKRLSAKFAYEKGIDFLSNQSEEISKELKDWGFNLNFAPCIDVNTNPLNPIIGERSFSNNPEDVINAMTAFIKASRNFEIIPCVKHYPGHGDADKDSHLTLPQINLSLEAMENIHIKPFKKAIENNIEMIMAAHLHCTCFDNEIKPASLSENAIGYLRKNLGYQGVIISDDMFMKGVQAYGNLEAVIMGINAGLDMFIFRESDTNTLEMIENLIKIIEKDSNLKEKVEKSYKRIIDLKQKYSLV
jgi:beta-N-acetylhexosaminidase